MSRKFNVHRLIAGGALVLTGLLPSTIVLARPPIGGDGGGGGSDCLGQSTGSLWVSPEKVDLGRRRRCTGVCRRRRGVRR